MRNIIRKVPKGERTIFGVIGGISRYIDPELDPLLLRLVTFIICIFNPVGILAYIIAAIILKTHTTPTIPADIIANFQKNNSKTAEEKNNNEPIKVNEDV